jgi:RNA polymerase sigma factor for flagellar operon FliA
VVHSTAREADCRLVPSAGGIPASDGAAAPPVVDTLLPLVRTIARTMSHGLPAVVELDDLVHDGVVGLLECARRFDPSRGVDFRTYAAHRIRGAILDGLRARDPLPRSIRRALKMAERERGAAPSRGAAARVAHLVSLEEAGPVPEDGEAPEERLLQEELRAAVLRAVADLPPRDRAVLHLRFTQGWRLREVAAHYSISISRVAELQERAIRRLRAVLDVPHPASLSPGGRRRRHPDG